jgi:hypothetical protein
LRLNFKNLKPTFGKILATTLTVKCKSRSNEKTSRT